MTFFLLFVVLCATTSSVQGFGIAPRIGVTRVAASRARASLPLQMHHEQTLVNTILSATKPLAPAAVKNGVVAVAAPVTMASLLYKTIQPLSGISSVKEAALVNLVICSILYIKKTKSLTTSGLLHATGLGIGLWTFLGWKGWLYCATYLVLGSLATKVKMGEKENLGIAEKRGGARGPENVWGSAATGMVCALLTHVIPCNYCGSLLRLGYVASIATKLSDTLGSEIGKAYGKNCYLITSLKRVPRGTEGAVSVEGTVAGIGGSLVLALVAKALGLISTDIQVVYTIIAAFVATTAESFIGAVFQDKIPWLTNELVNLINTFIGASVAILLAGYKVFV